jgi:hypothetical protein
LYDFLKETLGGEQVCGEYGYKYTTVILAWHETPGEQAVQQHQYQVRQQQQARDLYRIQHCAQHVESERLLALRLEGFVGRDEERATIQTAIESMRPTGGYVVVKAHAGEGKSSVIAKLVTEARVAATPHHFVALTPGRDYQLSLLRTIVAQLILKYGLDMGYFPEESYPAMKDLFAAVIRDIAALGHQETIYLDGLDQLEPELSGVRDLFFLPPQPPPGIVIVLGTRPDDTLQPLEPLHKVEYWLPHLARTDFMAVLKDHDVHLVPTMMTNLYTALEGNALYLTLAASELHGTAPGDAAGLVRTITANPGSLFTITLDRIKRSDKVLWERVVKPILGVLVVTQKPLTAPLLRSMLRVDHDDLTDGLRRLGGLVGQSNDGSYFLYHLKFRDYLIEPTPDQRERPFLFAQDDIVAWHQHLATWCLPDDQAVDSIWKTGVSVSDEQRHHYVRYYVITHLAKGKLYKQMWDILEDGHYGRQKRRFDPSTHLYALDLDRARDVAVQTDDLSRLWRWSFLRVSLTSYVDMWPDVLFTTLIHLRRGSEALSRIEMLSNSIEKVRLLGKLAPLLDPTTTQRVWERAQASANAIEDVGHRAEALSTLATAQAKAGLWADTHATIAMIDDARRRAEALSALAAAQAKASLWADTHATIAMIDDARRRAEALSALAAAQAKASLWADAHVTIATIDNSWLHSETLRSLAIAQAKAGLWTDAHATTTSIDDTRRRVAALSTLASVQAKVHHLDAATTFTQVYTIISTISDIQQRDEALHILVMAQAQAGLWAEANITIPTINSTRRRALALRDMATAQAQAGFWEDAQTTISTIEDTRRRAEALVALVTAQAKVGLWEDAQTTISTIEDTRRRAEALSILAFAQAKVNYADAPTTFIQAHTSIITIADVGRRTESLRALADVQAKARLWTDARTTIATITNTGQRALALRDLVATLAQSGLWADAHAISATIVDTRWRAEALSALAGAQAKVGLWDDAHATIDTIDNDWQHAEALCTLATIQVQARLWDDAHTTITTIENEWKRSEARQALAVAQAKAGLWDDAHITIDSITDTRWHIEAVTALALAQAQAGLWAETHVTINTIDDSWKRGEAIRVLVIAQAQAGLWADAHSTITTISDNDRYTEALRGLAAAEAEAGLWANAQDTIAIITDTRSRARAIYALIKALAKAGLWTDAQTIIATIDDIGRRAEALLTLATAQAKAGLWADTHITIVSIEDIGRRAEALSSLALAQAKVNHPDAPTTFIQANTIINTISNGKQRAEALRILAAAQTQAGLWTDAQTTIATIDNTRRRLLALRTLHSALIQAEDTLVLRKSISSIWRAARTSDALLTMISIAAPLFTLDPALSHDMIGAIKWVDSEVRDV